MPKVSVIVPNYNHARFLRQRIDTILAQTFQDFDLILLDDCSTDESRSILREYASDPRVQLEFNDSNSGSTFKQWNKGVRLAQGKYIWIAESDDYSDARFLERLVPLVDEDDEVMFAYCRSRRVGENGAAEGFGDQYLDLGTEQWASDFRMRGEVMCQKYFYRMNAVPNASSVVFRRGAYERAGGADGGLRLGGDWKLWAAMAMGGCVSYAAEPLNYFRFQASSVRAEAAASGVDVAELLEVSRWAIERVACSAKDVEKLREDRMGIWLPLLINPRTPLKLWLRVARAVLAIDPHAIRRAVRPATTAVRLKARRMWWEFRSPSVPSGNEKPQSERPPPPSIPR
jgi:hypothetical protein